MSHWQEFYAITKDKPPSPLLVKADAFVQNKEHALDLGAGALKDTKFLIAQGFKMVTVVDKESLEETDIKELPQSRINLVKSSFEDFTFPIEEYDIINAQYSLPFNSPQSFNFVFNKLKNSLKVNGIFTGQFFGVHDEWSGQKLDMAFHNLQQVKALLSDMEILEIEEVDKDSRLANGTPKH